MGRKAISMDEVKKVEVTDSHCCTCTAGDHKGLHKSDTVKVTLNSGKTREVRVCQNDIGIFIARPINTTKHIHIRGSNKSCVYPIQHHIAAQLYS